MTQELGKIKKVDLRNIWKKEDRDFTPWLKENIDLLSKKLDIEIIDTQTEENIGDFKLDIIGRDTNSNKFIAPHTFKIIKIDKDSSRYQCLLLNSVIGLLDIIRIREQTTGMYTDIMESDLNLFNAFNIDKLTETDKKSLNKSFNELKDIKFPSILKQLENRFDARIELDKKILD